MSVSSLGGILEQPSRNWSQRATLKGCPCVLPLTLARATTSLCLGRCLPLRFAVLFQRAKRVSRVSESLSIDLVSLCDYSSPEEGSEQYYGTAAIACATGGIESSIRSRHD